MKKAAVLTCGIVCAVLLAATASAGPPKPRYRGFDRVGRNSVEHVRAPTHQERAHRAVATRHAAKAPRTLDNRRNQGELWGSSGHRSSTHRRAPGNGSNRAMHYVQQKLQSKAQPAIRCADGVNCGRSMQGKARKSSSSTKQRKGFLQYSEAQQRYMHKIFQLRSEKWEPPESKALKSDCIDFATCGL